MFTKAQRIAIIKWMSVGLVTLSLLPIISHQLFFFPILQTYVELAIIAAVGYYGYKKLLEIWKW
jgi:hypothetical protein